MEYTVKAKIFDTLCFASEIHIEQRKKDYEKMPYINHIISVVSLLVKCGEDDADLLQAAILHDSVEDSKTTLETVAERYGLKVASIVEELSDDMTLDYTIRKEHQLNNSLVISKEAKLIRLADKTCNIRDFINFPINKTIEDQEKYCDWSLRIFERIKGNNIKLDNEFSKVLLDFNQNKAKNYKNRDEK